MLSGYFDDDYNELNFNFYEHSDDITFYDYDHDIDYIDIENLINSPPFSFDFDIATPIYYV